MDGNSTNAANPSLAGQHPEYISKQLQNFKSGDRKSPVMGPIAAKLSADDINNLGAYFGEQKAKPRTAKDKELATLGQKIYRGGNSSTGVPACAACHAPNGAGIPSQYPRLGGQHAEYVLTQLKNFRSGERSVKKSEVNVMPNIAGKMSDQEMKAVAEYIAGLR
jgi:cytochrome c553